MTETNLDVFHAQLLTPQDAPAMDQLCAACGTPGGPDTAALLQTNAVLGDYAGTDTLQAAMGMLPMFGQSRLALALRAAGFGADGQGIVLAPPAFTAQYLPVRRFLLELAPFESFDLEMARMVSGDPRAGERLDWIF